MKMSITNCLKIKEPTIKENKIYYSFEISPDIRKFFLRNNFYFEYDSDVSQVLLSIVYIPPVSSVIHLAWALGFQIYVPELDSEYLKSLQELKRVVQSYFPQFLFKEKTLMVEKTVQNSFQNDRYLLLFSGGLDSLCSYISHKDKNPILCTYQGFDINNEAKRHWKITKRNVERFCAQEKLERHFIKTNMMLDLLNTEEIEKKTHIAGWRSLVSSGLMLVSSLAPFTVQNSKKIIIASGSSDSLNGVWGSSPELDNKIRIANISVLHDGDTSSRQKKIVTLFSQHPELFPFLRVCTESVGKLNCCRCEKCYRMIVGLLVAGIDPNDCNFKFSEKDLSKIIKKFKKGQISSHPSYLIHLWREFQEYIPDDFKGLPLSSQELFHWLKTYDFEEHKVPFYQYKFYRIMRKIKRFRFWRLKYKAKRFLQNIKGKAYSWVYK